LKTKNRSCRLPGPVKAAGARMLRGGAYKPRASRTVSPAEAAGLALLARARGNGLPSSRR